MVLWNPKMIDFLNVVFAIKKHVGFMSNIIYLFVIS